MLPLNAQRLAIGRPSVIPQIILIAFGDGVSRAAIHGLGPQAFRALVADHVGHKFSVWSNPQLIHESRVGR